MDSSSEVLAVALWVVLAGSAAVLRVNFLGDGIRHLGPVLTSTRPYLGESRWLFFPALVFALIKPLQIAGVVTNVGDAARALAIFDFIAGLGYLVMLRRWLIAREVPHSSRAGSLLLAGMTYAMLALCSDTVEATIPATIALGGLVYCATSKPGAETRGAVAAASSIGFATLLYQGAFLAVALLPLAMRRGGANRRRTIVLALMVVSLAPLVMAGTTIASGRSPRAAISQMLTGEGNPLYKAELNSKRLPLWPYLAAVSAGPAESIVPIPGNRGIRGIVAGLTRRATLLGSAVDGAGFIFAAGIWFAVIAHTIRRRNWQLGIGFGGILILPLLRSFQYSYVKFYALMPALIALAAAGAAPPLVLGAGATVGAFNSVHLWRDIADGRERARALAPIYAHAGESACFVTRGWGPPTLGWPGYVSAFNGILSQSNAERTDEIVAQNNRALALSIRRCFCGAGPVLTDDLIDSSRAAVEELAGTYRFTGLDLSRVLWKPSRGTVEFDRDGVVLFSFSSEAQSEICAELKNRE